MWIKIGLSLLLFCCNAALAQQTLTQVLRGTVIDKQVKNALVGATVLITPSTPTRGAYTDHNGHFRFDGVPVGTYNVTVSYLGYLPHAVPNVVLNSGKETVLVIELEESVVNVKEVVITADKRKDLPINELSTVSTRTFSVDEAQHYAAAVNDPGRMVMSFPGVVAPDDGNNRIAIRGNAPNGLLWRMEGIDIPNPNHFSDVGTSGGGISILSSALLSNSDFSTGAFAAEYGNALSGVFDLKLRKGNNEKREHTAKAGFLGLSLASEGPFKKNYNGSYLVNYRYSTLGILNKLSLLDDPYHTNFQDLAYHIYLPTNKAGYFTLFGFGGLSDQGYTAPTDSSKWQTEGDRYGGKFFANTGVAGFTHGYIFNSKAYLKTALSITATGNGYDTEYMNDEYGITLLAHNHFVQHKQTVSSALNYKFNARLVMRSGLVQSRLSYQLQSKNAGHVGDHLITTLDTDNATYTTQAFSQLQFRITDNLTANAGFHGMYLWLNATYSVEPRASLKWDFTERQSVALGYGLHSQLQPIGVYFTQSVNANGETSQANKNLEPTKAHHVVLSYNYAFSENLRLKTELYYQHLFNVPIDRDSATSFSMLNLVDGFPTNPLHNAGTGDNYGAELTLEKYLSKRLYFLASASLYQSQYKGSDQKERNTRYNGNYAATFTGGKEFVLSRKSGNTLFGVNMKVLYAGGFRYTPINLDASVIANETVHYDNMAFSGKYPDYFRIDAGVSLKWNRPKLTNTLSLDVQNALNRSNIHSYGYEPMKQKIVTHSQTGLIPVLAYQVQF